MHKYFAAFYLFKYPIASSMLGKGNSKIMNYGMFCNKPYVMLLSYTVYTIQNANKQVITFTVLAFKRSHLSLVNPCSYRSKLM